jgi:hypothetical protein
MIPAVQPETGRRVVNLELARRLSRRAAIPAEVFSLGMNGECTTIAAILPETGQWREETRFGRYAAQGRATGGFGWALSIGRVPNRERRCSRGNSSGSGNLRFRICIRPSETQDWPGDGLEQMMAASVPMPRPRYDGFQEQKESFNCDTGYCATAAVDARSVTQLRTTSRRRIPR